MCQSMDSDSKSRSCTCCGQYPNRPDTRFPCSLIFSHCLFLLAIDLEILFEGLAPTPHFAMTLPPKEKPMISLEKQEWVTCHFVKRYKRLKDICCLFLGVMTYLVLFEITFILRLRRCKIPLRTATTSASHLRRGIQS